MGTPTAPENLPNDPVPDPVADLPTDGVLDGPADPIAGPVAAPERPAPPASPAEFPTIPAPDPVGGPFVDPLVAPFATTGSAPLVPAAVEPAARPISAINAVGPLSGIFFVALFLTSFMTMSTPDGDASDREWTSYWEDSGNRVQGITASITMMLAAVAFLWLVAALRRRVAGAVGTDAFYAAGVAAGGLMLLAGLGAGLIPLGYELADTPIPDDADVLRIVDGLYFGTVFLPLPYALAGFLIPLFFALRGEHLMPEWLRIATLVVGIVALTGPFLFFIPHVLFLLWTLAVSVVLLLRERGLPVIA